MVQRPTTRRRQGGFTLLLALGVVTMVTLAVLLSFGVVSREADVQGDSRRYKEAYFAAEAGLAEGREAMRIRLRTNSTYNEALGALTIINEPGLEGGLRPFFEVLPGPDGVGSWNSLAIDETELAPQERQSNGGEAYNGLPLQENVRYRVFARDDEEQTAGIPNDNNKQIWLIAVGEVVGPAGSRPTRAVIHALITNENSVAVTSPGTVQTGGGPDNTYNSSGAAPVALNTVATLPTNP
ncbi:Type IV fimbrial biogenesis protein PilX [Myxococcus hansupus]|uniref:Type IV fimbrial biogenesis protein PilX n=1 Tax=Pseudomyxococcus hansupus TaxID=1297742 RepID=A0A0H4X3G6_9BACT|nr:hypothetical protein [Myxococcus hansupus]AKQ69724.1 Type IV fimbrial biogenesis protein PilX [Myxococcus hansupus]